MRTTEREIMIGLKPSNIPGDDREKINSKANEGKYFLFLRSTETDARRCSVKKISLKIFSKVTGKHLCWRLFLLRLRGLALQLW